MHVPHWLGWVWLVTAKIRLGLGITYTKQQYSIDADINARLTIEW